MRLARILHADGLALRSTVGPRRARVLGVAVAVFVNILPERMPSELRLRARQQIELLALPLALAVVVAEVLDKFVPAQAEARNGGANNENGTECTSVKIMP